MMLDQRATPFPIKRTHNAKPHPRLVLATYAYDDILQQTASLNNNNSSKTPFSCSQMLHTFAFASNSIIPIY